MFHAPCEVAFGFVAVSVEAHVHYELAPSVIRAVEAQHGRGLHCQRKGCFDVVHIQPWVEDTHSVTRHEGKVFHVIHFEKDICRVIKIKPNENDICVLVIPEVQS